MMGALYMGNKPLVHVDHRVSLVVEEFVRLLHECGLRKTDLDLLHGRGGAMGEIMRRAQPRSTLFTGSRRVAERLARDHNGKVFLEDAGFDWKILGPDVQDIEHVAWQCDQDAYAATGQKCSAQSILFMHKNWARAGLEQMLKARAEQRSLTDLTVAPVLSWTTDAMLEHANRLLEIPGARVAWGAERLTGHTIPDVYGAIRPTAIFVPLRQILDDRYFELATTEVFGPFQVLTEYGDDDNGGDGEPARDVLEATERMDAHLTAAIVSNDVRFLHEVLGNTVNGTTYVGMRGRTTGAPQNHWFGPGRRPQGRGHRHARGHPAGVELPQGGDRGLFRGGVGPSDGQVS
jgi:1-pyrroline-5-carboxylate dehydrogenase